MRVTWAAITVLCLLAIGLLLGAVSWLIVDQVVWHQATGAGRDAALVLAVLVLLHAAVPRLVATLTEDQE